MCDLIEKLSNLRSQYNCFDENKRDAYHTLSEAIKVLSERPEPCEDAVSRTDVIDLYKRGAERIAKAKGISVEDLPHNGLDVLMNLPPVTPKRKIGRWIEEQRGIKLTLYKCSECGRAVIDDTSCDAAKDFPFCHCGADMRSEAE